MSQSDRNSSPVMNRRGLLKCAAWAGAGVVWTMRAGVLSSVELLNAAQAATKPQGGLSFVQISDSHVGFSKEPNLTPQVTLQSAIDQIRALPQQPSFVVHTGDVSQLSKPEEFDTAAEIVKGVGKTVHYVPGEHDVIGDDGRSFFTRFNGGADRKWYSFDADGAHFVIAIGNFTFSPANIEVPVGTKLTWANEDDVPHTIVSADGSPVIKSPPLDTDQKFTTIFDKPGTYRYFCSLHPQMTGTVVVR
jgi:Icc protein